ncbi:armadillo-type protein [Piptocephalis cylindrospora]|uniref:Importin-95 n=1 Tax=Piptocephalis cylindrospora TaxID=1907219 RepID=A0A4P9YB50_9FUNG|nr:armadillo-type protein [Piptocephalis cylindrospora]|eukprot:RKP15350.1 armadillo-type protein [Piptocephalis cylindrospora]
MDGSLGEILSNTLSPVQETRQNATQRLEQAAKENFPEFVSALSTVLSKEDAPESVRNAAGLVLKNTLSAQDYTRYEEQKARWFSLDPSLRSQAKAMTLQTLHSPVSSARRVAGQAVAEMARVELPENQWPELIPVLLANVNESPAEAVGLKDATIQAIGYLCESVSDAVLSPHLNSILTAVVRGIASDQEASVQYSALTALYNAFPFIESNFTREHERNYIMQVVCEATQHPSPTVKIAAFSNLVRAMQLYYAYMSPYMQKALFGLTIQGMQSEEEGVALQAIEFWATVCDCEYDLDLDAQERALAGEDGSGEGGEGVQNYRFAAQAYGDIATVLLWLLTQQDEDADEDEWGKAMAAATCLSLFANTIHDAAVPPVVSFVETNIQSSSWNLREAAVMAFGSILEGPTPERLASLVNDALPLLVSMVQDPVVAVKDSAAWTLGRVCEHMMRQLDPNSQVPPVVGALIQGLGDSPRVSTNCSYGIMCLADSLSHISSDAAKEHGGRSERAWALTPFYESLLTALSAVCDRPGNEGNCRTAAFEAIAALVRGAPDSTVNLLATVLTSMLGRLDGSVERGTAQVVGMDDRLALQDLQSSLCGVISEVTRRVGGDLGESGADRVMHSLLALIRPSNKDTFSSPVMEDAMLAVGSVIQGVGPGFSRYLDSFLPILYSALHHWKDLELYRIAVGLVGDLSRALGPGLSVASDALMSLLMQALASPMVDGSVKPSILAVFGVVALALGALFEPYLDTVMISALQGASTFPSSYDDPLQVAYACEVREALIECLTSVLQGLRGDGKAALLQNYISAWFNWLKQLTQEPPSSPTRTSEILYGVVGLLGDIAEAFPRGEVSSLLSQPWVDQWIREARAFRDPQGLYKSKRDMIRWSREMVKRARQPTA